MELFIIIASKCGGTIIKGLREKTICGTHLNFENDFIFL
jgi:hypothetical protein